MDSRPSNGLIIRRLLKANGYSIRKLAAELERSATSVHSVIHGKTRSNYIETRICEIIGTTPQELWGYHN